MTYRKIIVGTDGSGTARVAERTAAMLAKAEDAQLLLAYATRDSAEAAQPTLQQSLEAATQVWPRVEIRRAHGRAADVLVDLAQTEEADLLVVGNKGMTGRARFLLGSVPDAVSHSSPCDLLIVNTAADKGSPGGGIPYRKILVATDASQTSLEAVRRGFDLAQSLGATPILFYAGHPKTAEIIFQEVAREFLPAGMLQTATAEGDPAKIISGVAMSEGYDLAVIGNKGMIGAGLHIGSVPNQVSHRTSTDLLIVKTVSTAVAELANGEGAIVKMDGDTVAVFRDTEGVLHKLSPRCTHMGCTVGWNSDQGTWDCPCHGSRYGARGEVIRGPAANPLARIGTAE